MRLSQCAYKFCDHNLQLEQPPKQTQKYKQNKEIKLEKLVLRK